MMKGMTPEQYAEVLAFVKKYHGFYGFKDDKQLKEIAKLFPGLKEKDRLRGYSIKYVEATYDSRDGCIWSIKFRIGNGIWFATNGDQGDYNFTNLYDWVMAFLKGEIEVNKWQHSGPIYCDGAEVLKWAGKQAEKVKRSIESFDAMQPDSHPDDGFVDKKALEVPILAAIVEAFHKGRDRNHKLDVELLKKFTLEMFAENPHTNDIEEWYEDHTFTERMENVIDLGR